jgi:choline dehydrogenase-like flavoprotein
MMQVIRSPKVHDVCTIGSGAAGGAAAKVLTEGGVDVVMLEAGPPLNPAKDFKEHLWPYPSSSRRRNWRQTEGPRKPTSSWRRTALGK